MRTCRVPQYGSTQAKYPGMISGLRTVEYQNITLYGPEDSVQGIYTYA